MQKRGITIDSLALIFAFIIFAQLLSYVIPQGTYSSPMPIVNEPAENMAKQPRISIHGLCPRW